MWQFANQKSCLLLFSSTPFERGGSVDTSIVCMPYTVTVAQARCEESGVGVKPPALLHRSRVAVTEWDRAFGTVTKQGVGVGTI